MSRKTNYGKNLNSLWNVRAKHALYYKDGNWYQVLTRFPGALFDPHGYILFRTSEEFEKCPSLNIGTKVNVIGKISEIPGYKKIR